jgi:hypothetical protein
MSVSDGQLVNAAVTNAAFMSRTQDTSTTGKVALQNGSSGGTLLNAQQDINDIFDTVGISGENDANAKVYSSNEVIANGDDRKVAIEKIDAHFDNASGHDHSGLAGQGAPIDGETLAGNLLLKQSLFSLAFVDATTTGSNQTLANPIRALIILTNPGLVSLSGITPPASDSQFFVLMNSTGNTITVVDSNAAVDDIVTGTGSDFSMSDDAAAFIAYDSSSSRWKIIGGSGGGSIAYQEVPTGTVNGINPTFGPLTYLPSDDNSALVLVDGLAQTLGVHFTITGSTITFLAGSIPASGQSVYVYYLTGGSPSVPVLNGTYRVEYRTITAPEAAAENLTLAFVPGTPSYVSLDVIGGGPGFYGTDFTVAGSILDWSSGSFSGLITAGDQFRIIYTE